MPLMEVTLERGLSGETKAALRRDLCRDMAELVGLDPSFIGVLFKELPEGGTHGHGSFTEVYLSEGRDLEFKGRLMRFVCEDICRHTALDGGQVSVIIHDIRRGSVAVSGHVVNRGGTAAETVIRERGETVYRAADGRKD